MRVMDEKKLQEITEFIKQYARENNGDAPGLADIMDYMSMAKTTAYRYVLELKKRGIISYNGKKTLENLRADGLPTLEDTDARNKWLHQSSRTFTTVQEAIEFLESLQTNV